MTFAAAAAAVAAVDVADAVADYVRASCFETDFVAAIVGAHCGADW